MRCVRPAGPRTISAHAGGTHFPGFQARVPFLPRLTSHGVMPTLQVEGLLREPGRHLSRFANFSFVHRGPPPCKTRPSQIIARSFLRSASLGQATGQAARWPTFCVPRVRCRDARPLGGGCRGVSWGPKKARFIYHCVGSRTAGSPESAPVAPDPTPRPRRDPACRDADPPVARAETRLVACVERVERVVTDTVITRRLTTAAQKSGRQYVNCRSWMCGFRFFPVDVVLVDTSHHSPVHPSSRTHRASLGSADGLNTGRAAGFHQKLSL